MNHSKRHPAMSSINRMKRLYRKLCEEHPDPKVQRIAQGMESALRWATEDTRGWRMEKEPTLLAKCLEDDLKMMRFDPTIPRRALRKIVRKNDAHIGDRGEDVDQIHDCFCVRCIAVRALRPKLSDERL